MRNGDGGGGGLGYSAGEKLLSLLWKKSYDLVICKLLEKIKINFSIDVFVGVAILTA